MTPAQPEPLEHPPLGVPEPAPGPPSRRARFERLEYGKLCVSPDGPIEQGSEAYPLVRSAGFPSALEPLCHPATIGVGSDLPAGVSEGWVLRSARHPGGVTPIACRLRRRPEDGEGGVRRRYWLARYVCCREDEPMDPFTFYQALRAAPLRGITVEEAKAVWNPIDVEPSRSPEFDPLLLAFLQEAIAFAISAVPVGLASRIAPEEFFRWAAALWALLPPGLRPAFSAGWGIAPSETPAFNFAFTLRYPPTIAVFDLQRGTWNPPSERVSLTDTGEERSISWRDSDLVPGRMYLREAFPWGADGRPVLRSFDSAPRRFADGDCGLAGTPTPEIVDLRSPWTARCFTGPGLQSLDHARLQILRQWLEGPAAQEPQGLCVSTADYFTAAGRHEVLKLALQATGTAVPNPRGDVVIWASLRDDPQALEGLGGRAGAAVHPRAHLFLALARGDSEAALAALAAGAAVADALPADAERRFTDCLGRSLDSEALLDLHGEILRQPSLPQTYRRWLEQEGQRLGVALAARPGSGAALQALADLTRDSFIASLARWRQGLPATEADAEAWKRAGADSGERALRLFVQEWDNVRTAARREQLLPWLEMARLESMTKGLDPLLRIWAEGLEVRLLPEERPRLVKAIEDGCVPPSLQPRVAAVVLQQWYFFRESFAASFPGWLALIAHWPADVRLALVNESGTVSERRVTAEVQAALGDFRLPSDLLERHIEGHRRSAPANIGRVAPLLWEWCRKSQSMARLHAPDICRCLAEGTWPQGPVSMEAAELAAFLTRHVGFFRREPSLLRKLWSLAREAWQIFLLLQSAPDADLEPALWQLESLVPYRRQLEAYLALPGVPGKRRKRFEIASFDFHHLDYPEEGRWKAIYKNSILWAAFGGVPGDKQGDLAAAINSYACEEGGCSFNEKRIHLATRYLSESRQKEYGQAVRRVARALVLPLAQEAGVDQARLVKIVRALYAKRDSIPVTDDGISALKEGREGLRIARWYKHFLLNVHDWNGGEALLAELER